MKPRVAQNRTQDRGISQVIGIVLLVGITVVLVGLVAVYMTGFAESNQEPAPRLAVDTEFNDSYGGNGQYLNLTHESGAPIDTERIYFKVQDARVRAGGSHTGPATYEGNVIAEQAGSEWNATDTVSLNRTQFVDDSGADLSGTDYLDLREATVLIVWEAEGDADRTEIIYECAPQAGGCASQ